MRAPILLVLPKLFQKQASIYTIRKNSGAVNSFGTESTTFTKKLYKSAEKKKRQTIAFLGKNDKRCGKT